MRGSVPRDGACGNSRASRAETLILCRFAGLFDGSEVVFL